MTSTDQLDEIDYPATDSSRWEWMMRVCGWDGLLPVAVWGVPYAIAVIWPGNDDVNLMAAVVIPIIAAGIRYRAGIKYIQTNRSSPLFQKVQFVVFCLALFWLLLIDSLLIAAQQFPNIPRPGQRFDFGIVIVFGCFFLVYLLLMTIAMYPGSAESASAGRVPAEP